ncbi:hypothetical protein KKI24_14285 [bacterium]|nr:hypothetical protein [bacterium]
MKKLFLILIFLALIGGCQDTSTDEAATTDGTTTTGTDTGTTTGTTTVDTGGVTAPAVATVTNISKIPITGLTNLVISTGTPSAAMYAGTTKKKLYTVKNGAMEEVTLEGGADLEVQKIHKVKAGTHYKAYFEFTDASGDTKRYIVDKDGNASVANFTPKKASALANAEYLQEVSGKIYYLNSTGVRSMTVPAVGKMMSGDATTDILESAGAIGFAINPNGEMVIEATTDVFYRKTDGALNDLDDPYIDEARGFYWDADASTNRFYVTQGSGFMVKRAFDKNDFIRYYTKDGAIKAQYSQEKAYNQYLDGVNGVYYQVKTTKTLGNCRYLKMGASELMVCDSEVYNLGDASTDIKRVSMHYASHLVFNFALVASTNNIYVYSENEDGTPRKLSKEDVVNSVSTPIVTVHATIPQTIDYKINTATLEVTPDDTLSFCATKSGESYVVQISDANTTPVITEVAATCEYITPL